MKYQEKFISDLIDCAHQNQGNDVGELLQQAASLVEQKQAKQEELVNHLKEIDKHLYNISLAWGAPLSTEQKLTRVIDIMIEEMPVVLDRRIVPNL